MYAKKKSPVTKTADASAASVLDSSSQGESLQRKADLVNCSEQRVVQKIDGVVQRAQEADESFEYVTNLDDNIFINGADGRGGDERFRSNIPFKDGKIVFSKYSGQPMQSCGFTGCLMMAFHFNEDVGKGIQPATSAKTLCPGFPEKNLTANDKFIAHVFMSDLTNVTDTRTALYDAEQRGLINVDALFKPFVPRDSEIIFNAAVSNQGLRNHLHENRPVKNDSFRGRMSLGGDGRWRADVLAETEDVYNAIKNNYTLYEEEKKLKEFSTDELSFQTQATKVFIWASLLLKRDIDVEMKRSVKKELEKMAKENKDVVNYAKDYLTNDEHVKMILRKTLSSFRCLLL